MKINVVFTVDDVNYHGGAHVALYNQIDYLLSTEQYNVSIISKTFPEEGLVERFCNVTFIKDVYTKRRLVSILSKYDCVCVPFENSVYREIVSKCKSPHKIQWIHIDYFEWRKINQYTIKASEKDRIIYQNFDQIVFVSKASRRGFLMMYPELVTKCHVCYNLIDTERIFRLSSDLSEYNAFLKDNVMHIVTVARIDDEQKGIKRYINVAKKLVNDGYDFEWIFLGDGPEFENTRTLVETYGLSSYVRLLGHSLNPYVYIKNADVFALFSYYEGIPNTVFEALILGTPVIATAVTGIKEQVSDSVGYLVPNLEKEIYFGMKYILDNPLKIIYYKENLKSYKYNNDEIKSKLNTIFASKEICSDSIDIPPLVSVIVPVYNVQKYLGECLESLISQTLNNIEIIVVNDGSSDLSQEIIDDFYKKYPSKIVPLYKENGGLGSARNYGVQHAKGYFVAFVDGDDWVDKRCYESMFTKAISGNYDMVLCDLYGFDEVTKKLSYDRAPYRAEGKIDKKESIMLSTRPVAVSACTKLFKRDIFQSFSFPAGWYEDLAIMPIIFSYIQNIYYLPKPLYYYRWNRQGSIQSQKYSEQTLDVFKAKANVIANCNREYLCECCYAVYDHICRFKNDFPMYAGECLRFVNDKKYKDLFRNNAYIIKSIADKKLPQLFGDGEIPKKIHYCWFGRGEKSKLVRECIDSWHKNLPDYEIIEWNENNCNVEENAYVAEAYREKKWAFVADYFRFKVLYEYGGIYLDTDVLVYQSFNTLLYNKAFFAFETYLYVHGGIIGAQPEEHVIGDILETYNSDCYKGKEGYTVCHRITEVLLKYGLQRNAQFQVAEEDIAIYAPNVMTINVSDGQCVAEHLYDASWLENRVNGKTYKYEVLKNYFAVLYEREMMQDKTEGFYKREYERMLMSKSWKVTKPLRVITDFIRKVYGKLLCKI